MGSNAAHEELEPGEKPRQRRITVADSRDSDVLCGPKCFVGTAVALFLFLAFVALPAGAFLIISGRNKDDIGLLIGGALVMCVPVLVGIILTIVFCVRRHRKMATFTSVSTARV
ncbi:hypothetical protein PoB_001154600 [Plakobranchus ocellatus]|uniref:Transmembrane protein 230 n=1 Tax=Plakobranchus ocellatus TaxID=259542 RepID=A0AAV3YCI0_9GAST|nr:hypothetical protein PoB_001154600 [Plakobranchus ocellatus]